MVTTQFKQILPVWTPHGLKMTDHFLCFRVIFGHGLDLTWTGSETLWSDDWWHHMGLSWSFCWLVTSWRHMCGHLLCLAWPGLAPATATSGSSCQPGADFWWSKGLSESERNIVVLGVCRATCCIGCGLFFLHQFLVWKKVSSQQARRGLPWTSCTWPSKETFRSDTFMVFTHDSFSAAREWESSSCKGRHGAAVWGWEDIGYWYWPTKMGLQDKRACGY